MTCMTQKSLHTEKCPTIAGGNSESEQGTLETVQFTELVTAYKHGNEQTLAW